MLRKNEYTALGAMSGTSLDGLDLAVCRFKHERSNWSFNILKSITIPYPESLRNKLRNAHISSGLELIRLDAELGKFIGTAAKNFITGAQLNADLIASHGHTIFHEPAKGYTLQIGNGHQIAAINNVPTISNFRMMDVAHGGQGAPLAPIGDKYLFSEYDACINLGGFANLSFDDADGNRIAFDICPVNFVLNRLSEKLGKEYDENGELGKSGIVLHDLLEKLNTLEYYSLSAPKSLGQEWVEANLSSVFEEGLATRDLMRTFYEHAAHQIACAISEVKGDNVLISGGGAHNSFLISLINQKVSRNFIIPDKELVDMKEALIFAFLGVLRIRNEINSLSSVTGASKDSVNGTIHLP